MRRLIVLVASIVFASLAIVGGSTHSAKAAPSYYDWIWQGSSSELCVQDNSNGTSGAYLYTNACGANGTDWGPSLSSWGNGTYSIVDSAHPHGEMCLDDVGQGADGVQLRILGCNGSAEQAWLQVCDDYGNPALRDGYGQTVDLYGDNHNYGVRVVAWHLYAINGGQPLPDAEQWSGPFNPQTC